MPRCIQGNYTDPVTGLPQIAGAVRVTQDGSIRGTMVTGAPWGSISTTPGYYPPLPPQFTNQNPVDRTAQDGSIRLTQDGSIRIIQQPIEAQIGLPYGYTEVPPTGPLPPP